MHRKLLLRHWLEAKVFTGRLAVLWGLAAIAIPTAIRGSVDGVVTDAGMTAYVPFVLISAIVLGWKEAALVALGSAAVGDALFIGVPGKILEGPTDIFAVSAFLAASAALISFAHLVRAMVADAHKRRGKGEPPIGIIFSLENGEAWASWNGQALPVRLGRRNEVAESMRDFLAQLDVGTRLAAQSSQAVSGRSPADLAMSASTQS